MYEIPQQLEYKEKIVFGLTFKQLAYAFGFFPLVFFLLFKINASWAVRIFLAIYPASLAVGFIFFDLDEKLKKWISWFMLREISAKREKGKIDKLWEMISEKNKKFLIERWKRMKKDKEGFWFKLSKWLNRNRIKEFFSIIKVEDNLIYTKKNKIAVLKVEPINFDIKHEKEKEAITLAFQKLLNSLDFPIQIVMTTDNLSLESYLSNLGEKSHSKQIFHEYEKHIKGVVKNESVSNRNFYLAIPEKTNLDIQIKICEERLHALNLKTYRLNDKQLEKLFSNFNDAEKIENSPFYVSIKDNIIRTIYAHGYPRSVEAGFLDKIVSSVGNFNLSIHIEPMPLESTMVLLNRELQKQRADLYAAKIKDQINPSLEIKYKDTLNILRNLQKGDEKLFNVSLYIACTSDRKDKLDLLTKKVESELNSLLIIPKWTDFQMIQGYKSCLPLCEDSINMKRNITTKGLSTFFPFTSSFFKFDKTGIWFGLNRNKIPIIRDVFKLPNPNGLVLAQSGGGKSYFCKLLISRYLLNNTKVMVIDLQGEYNALVSHFKGQTINLSRDSPTIINPLDLMGHNYLEKRLSLLDLMKIMLGELTDIQRAYIDRAITETYKRKGITKNPDTWNNEPPILGDLIKVLDSMEKKGSKLEQSTLASLSNRLDMYVHGVFSFLNRKTNINFNNNFVSFDVSNLPAQIKPAIMFLVLDYIYMKMKSNLNRKILLIDEAWLLLSRAEDAGYIFEIVKTCRKFNLGLLLINQEVEGMLDSKAGKSVLANSSYTFLMRQKPAVIDTICKTFHLSNNERTHLLTANVGEGLLIMEDDHSILRVIASPEEHKLITTNPDELKNFKVQPKKAVYKDVNIRINEDKRYFRKKLLGKDEINFLLSKEYKICEYKSLLTDRMETFLLQPRHNESPMHLFMTKNIAEYLEKNGIEVELYTTVKPDIVFGINGKRYAIEIETGSYLSRMKGFKEKVETLNKNYDEWFFVVTNKNKVKIYKKFGDAVDKRYVKLRLDKLLKLAKKP
ncbi:MAG: DUF87 domain-containing protein [Nanoarchaeota archaeon]